MKMKLQTTDRNDAWVDTCFPYITVQGTAISVLTLHETAQTSICAPGKGRK